MDNSSVRGISGYSVKALVEIKRLCATVFCEYISDIHFGNLRSGCKCFFNLHKGFHECNPIAFHSVAHTLYLHVILATFEHCDR